MTHRMARHPAPNCCSHATCCRMHAHHTPFSLCCTMRHTMLYPWSAARSRRRHVHPCDTTYSDLVMGRCTLLSHAHTCALLHARDTNICTFMPRAVALQGVLAGCMHASMAAASFVLPAASFFLPAASPLFFSQLHPHFSSFTCVAFCFTWSSQGLQRPSALGLQRPSVGSWFQRVFDIACIAGGFVP